MNTPEPDIVRGKDPEASLQKAVVVKKQTKFFLNQI